MDGHLEGMESIFADYKRKMEESQAAGAQSEEAQKRAVEALKATARRRRLMKREMESKISELTKELKSTLAAVQGREVEVSSEEALYYQLKDT